MKMSPGLPENTEHHEDPMVLNEKSLPSLPEKGLESLKDHESHGAHDNSMLFNGKSSSALPESPKQPRKHRKPRYIQIANENAPASPRKPEHFETKANGIQLLFYVFFRKGGVISLRGFYYVEAKPKLLQK